MRNVIERGVIGLIMLAFVGVTIFLGQLALFVVALALSVAGFFELNLVLEQWGMRAFALPTLLFGVSALISFFVGQPGLVLASGLLLLMSSAVWLVLHPNLHPRRVIGSVFSFLYIFVPFGMLLGMPHAIYLYLVLIASWGTDTFAYIFGMLFGRHKLIPSISPNKSVEGAIGGTVASGWIAWLVLRSMGAAHLVPVFFCMLLASVLSQFGDLFASKMKRESGRKDYGTIFKGHGGVLDRFDSMLFVIPFLYTLSFWLNLLGW